MVCMRCTAPQETVVSSPEDRHLQKKITEMPCPSGQELSANACPRVAISLRGYVSCIDPCRRTLPTHNTASRLVHTVSLDDTRPFVVLRPTASPLATLLHCVTDQRQRRAPVSRRAAQGAPQGDAHWATAVDAPPPRGQPLVERPGGGRRRNVVQGRHSAAALAPQGPGAVNAPRARGPYAPQRRARPERRSAAPHLAAYGALGAAAARPLGHRPLGARRRSFGDS